MNSDKYNVDAECVGLCRAYCRANLRNSLKNEGNSESQVLRDTVRDYNQADLLVNSHWQPDEHAQWVELIKAGRDIEYIAASIKTKSPA